MTATFVGMPRVPRGRARRRWATPSCATTWRTPPTPSATSARAVVAEVAGAGRSCGWPAPAVKDATLRRARPATSSSSRRRWSAAARSCTGRATPRRPARIVAEVAKAHGVDEVVKVKSMATQEIGLNEALAAEGIAAWETDLAELIVQLGDDLPSHILVPAIHRNRAEIREIFRDPDGRAPAAPRPTTSPTTRPSWRTPPACTCARSSCAPRSASRAPTSRSPRPARWSSSSRRATAGCA